MTSLPPKLKVVHVLGDASVAGRGIAQFPSVLARRLDAARFEIHALLLGAPGPLTDELEAEGVRTSLVDWSSRPTPGAILRLRRALRSRGFGMVHQHFGGRSVRAGARWSTGAPVVAHLHGIHDEATLRPFEFKISGADAVIAASHAIAAHVGDPRAIVVYAGVPERPWIERATQDELTIGTAGRLSPIKGQAHLLRAMSELADSVVLEFAGDGSERGRLTQQAAQLGIADRVRFLGWRSDLDKVMRRWDVYVQPSLSEGFGMAVLDAMSWGLPVVASRVGGLVELVADGESGILVPAGEERALSDALSTLAGAPEARSSMGHAGWKRARSHFSEDRMSAEIAHLYESLIAERGGGRPTA